MKARARRAAQELAGELLNLYAERAPPRPRLSGSPTSCASLEAAFPYRETPDQRDAIDAVLEDGDRAADGPADRGDVGYGKTEVAERRPAASAASKVLMLVLTTILAQQHYGTFTERLRDHPFIIEHVSRFGPPAEQRDDQALRRARSTS